MQMQIPHSLVVLVVSLGIFGVNGSPIALCGDAVATAAPVAVDAAPVVAAPVVDAPAVVDVAPECDTEVVADAAPVVDTPAVDVPCVDEVAPAAPAVLTVEQVDRLRPVYTQVIEKAPDCGCTDNFDDAANVKLISEVAVRENIVPADFFANYQHVLVKRSPSPRKANSNRDNDVNIVGPRFGGSGCGGGGPQQMHDHGNGGGECDEEGGSGLFSHNHNQAINQNIDKNQNLNADSIREGRHGFAKRDEGEDPGFAAFNDNNNQDINQNIIANQNLIANLPVADFFGSGRKERGTSCCCGPAAPAKPAIQSDDDFNVNNQIHFADCEGFFEKRSLEKRDLFGVEYPSVHADSGFHVNNGVKFADKKKPGCKGPALAKREAEPEAGKKKPCNCCNGKGGCNRTLAKRQEHRGALFSDNHNQDINQDIVSNQNLNVDFIHTMGESMRGLFGGFGGFGGEEDGEEEGEEGTQSIGKRSLEKREWACGSVGGVRGCYSDCPPGGCSGSGNGFSASSTDSALNTNSNINVNQNYNPAPEVECIEETVVEYVPIVQTQTIVHEVPVVETVTVYATPVVEYEYVEVPACAPTVAPCPHCAGSCGCASDEPDVNTSSSSSTSSPVVNNYIDVGAAAVGPIEPVVPVTTVDTVDSCESIGFEDTVESITPAVSCTSCNQNPNVNNYFVKRDQTNCGDNVEYLGRIGDGCDNTLSSPARVDTCTTEIIEPVVAAVVEPVVPVVSETIVESTGPIIETHGHRTTTVVEHPTVEIIHPAPPPVVREVIVEQPVVPVVVEPVVPVVEVEVVPVVEEEVCAHADHEIHTSTTTTCAGYDPVPPVMDFVGSYMNKAPLAGLLEVDCDN